MSSKQIPNKNVEWLNSSLVSLDVISKDELRNSEKKLTITYSFGTTPYGKILIASTAKGICYVGFCDKKLNGIEEIVKRFPKAIFRKQDTKAHKNCVLFFKQKWDKVEPVKLHLKGTDFQIKVWEALLHIPIGKVTTYRELANLISHPKASRAVGTAVGKNPVVFLVPCHRVICSSGKLGGFYWGIERKVKMLNKEAKTGKKISGMKNWEPTFM